MTEHAWQLRPIRVDEAAEAKWLIYAVAHALMEPESTLEAFTAQWEAWGILADLDDVSLTYFGNSGVFLVIVVNGQLVGTGAFHRDAERPGVCELRRIALLPEYRGQGLGYALMQELISRARALGYATMGLWTNRFKLERAVAFYRQLGFVEVVHAGASEEEIYMDLALTEPTQAYVPPALRPLPTVSLPTA